MSDRKNVSEHLAKAYGLPERGIRTAPGPMRFGFRRVRPGAPALTKAKPDDAGWDISYWPPDPQIPPALRVHGNTGWFLLETGIAVDLPPGWVLKAEGRSGLAANHGVGLRAGVIDAGYQGELRVVLSVPFELYTPSHRLEAWPTAKWQPKPGDRIAQLLVLPVPEVEWVEVESFPPTIRGTDGMGSTGA